MYLLEAFGIREATDRMCEFAGLETLDWTDYEMTPEDFASLCSTL
jgi:hypothetical protein